MLKRLLAMATAGLVSIGLAYSPASLPQASAAPMLNGNVSKKRKKGLFNGRPVPSSVALAGGSSIRISVAQAKRNAVKRHNQRRHQRACRG